ncbi:hypothetical protein [Stutzerimonas stutzeri]|uniref:hypothetical protein n=1 Tax=Stutzerimonas stutzeri TaxID=316 RepID=UPI003C6FA431
MRKSCRSPTAPPVPPLSSPTLPVVLGAQIGDFSGQSLFEAFNREWTVDQRADRMRGPTAQRQQRELLVNWR